MVEACEKNGETYTCFSDESTAALNKYLLEIQQWMDQTEAACGYVPEETS